MNLKHGSFEVNPPFVPAILTAAAQHMLQMLAAAEAAGSALSFCVLMPGWQEVDGWQQINGSSFLRQSLLLAAADHGELACAVCVLMEGKEGVGGWAWRTCMCVCACGSRLAWLMSSQPPHANKAYPLTCPLVPPDSHTNTHTTTQTQ